MNTSALGTQVPRTLAAVTVIALAIAVGCSRKPPKIASGSLTAEASHDLMVAKLADIAKRSSDDNIFVGDRVVRTARQSLKGLPSTASRLQRWLKTYQLAKAELHQGNESESIRLMAAAQDLIQDNPQEIKPEILRQFYFDMAVAYLRWGETENCCRRNTPTSCIMPLRGEAIHLHPEGSRRSILWLTVLLKMTEAEESMHLAARWLLNLAHMTLDEYPSAVPSEYRIDDLDAGLDGTIQAWANIADAAGVATFSLAGGAVADDFDNDGDVDLIVSSSDPRESLQVFWNDGAGSFQNGTSQSNLHAILGGLNLVQTDYNNDGLLDVFVMRGGWLAAAGCHPNSLLRNNGDHSFTDVTITAGLAGPALPTQTAAWADYDLDGDLDVYIGNEATRELEAPSQLFRNEGDGTFVDVAEAAGLTNDRLAKAVAWGDYDGDRYPDLYVSNYRGGNRFYQNRGDGTFQDIAPQLAVQGPEASFPTWFCDVNNDGHLDLFVAAYAGGIAEVAAAALGRPFDREATLAKLYVNNVQHRFTNRAAKWGLVHPTHPMGANFGDVDNDGFVDFYLGTGWPEYHELMPNVLFQNVAGTRFQDITNAARVGHLQKGHAVAMADFDRDGDLDIFEQMGGFVPGDKFYDVLYQNPGSTDNWISLKLVGQVSNRAAVGARIHVRVRQGNAEASIYRHVSAGGSFGANPFEQHLGLGGATEILQVEVFWPVTGRTDIYANPPMNQRMRLTEGAQHPESLE